MFNNNVLLSNLYFTHITHATDGCTDRCTYPYRFLEIVLRMTLNDVINESLKNEIYNQENLENFWKMSIGCRIV